jgi:nicotinate-nucleotide pyrophosphorylase (carboxylating)
MNTTPLIRAALNEDLGSRGDVTTSLFVAPRARLKASVIARQNGIVCGTKIASEVFTRVDPSCHVKIYISDGRALRAGDVIMTIRGGRGILTAERTALNFLQRLSGVATLTAQYCARVRGTSARIYDTRKTIPGWRELDKYAVRCGGGSNHRMGLYDAVLLKDNHWAAGQDVEAGVRASRRLYRGIVVEVEADDLSQVERALEIGADIILLDNMKPARLRRAIALIRSRNPATQIEISGGVSLSTIRSLAKLGPDRISIGRITHSAPALDLGLDLL